MDAWNALILPSTALVSGLAVFTRPGWHYARHGATLAHELGHAVVSSLTFAKVSGIRLDSDSSGGTHSTRTVSVFPLGAIVSSVFGYPFPVLLGSVVLSFIIAGYPMVALFTLLGAGIVTLLFIRNLFGFLVTGIWLALAGLCFLVPVLAPWYIAFMASFLIFAGVKDLSMLYDIHKHDVEESTDLHTLKYNSHIPMMFWYILMWVISLICLAVPVIVLMETLTTS